MDDVKHKYGFDPGGGEPILFWLSVLWGAWRIAIPPLVLLDLIFGWHLL